MSISYTLFTKPWKSKSLPELAKFVHELGFDGVEFPIRPGFQVEPENITKGLPKAARIFADHGVRIGTLAGPTDEITIAACAEAAVPIIRVCEKIDLDIGYMASEKKLREKYDAIVPTLDQHGVAIGVQNHADMNVNNAMGLLHLIEDYDPKHICAVLDQAHNGLNGEPPELAIDIVWSHLKVANLKSAYWERTTGDNALEAEWKKVWTTGRHGLAYWTRTVRELKKRNYSGDICLTAEYSDPDQIDANVAEDIFYAKHLFNTVEV